MSVGLTLYRSLSRIVHAFARHELPLAGAAGTRWAAPSAENIKHLQHLFRSSPQPSSQNINNGMRTLRQLQAKLQVLLEADEMAREAMAGWCRMQNKTAEHLEDQSYVAISTSALLLWHQTKMADAGYGCASALSQSLEQDSQFKARLTELADAVRQSASHEDLFCGDWDGTDVPAEPRRLQLEHISKVLFEEYRFRQAPFEWVYDGLSPVMMNQVLDSRKGLSIVLASIYLLVARLLGIELIMLPEAAAEAADGPAGFGPLGTATIATAPEPARWHLYDTGPVALCVDPLAKGAVTELSPSHPALQEAGKPFHMAVWAEQARIMITAYQRRGESDAVAHWIYQLMALDADAVEWQMFGEVAANAK